MTKICEPLHLEFQSIPKCVLKAKNLKGSALNHHSFFSCPKGDVWGNMEIESPGSTKIIMFIVFIPCSSRATFGNSVEKPGADPWRRCGHSPFFIPRSERICKPVMKHRELRGLTAAGRKVQMAWSGSTRSTQHKAGSDMAIERISSTNHLASTEIERIIATNHPHINHSKFRGEYLET